ncbi:FimB/Mfa2 family fimbrial subunit [uncultured Porphyromonas sp.]|uniref:FimB/Mfa2 family fimbrial subunit n=1 Tax=uncultured Porphyromonas sp. TaxID=159274 RepID=UPI002639ABB3|nr:FimB/Mfa2 family fimbrial subunit [uncultured Porphyromonas sp.]
MAKKVLLLPLTVLLMALLSSCVYEDLSKCPEPRLRFVYNADGSDNVLPNYIKDGQLYMYDESGAVCYTQQLTRRDLAEGIQLPVLTFAQYRVIAWANVTKQSQIANPDQLAKADLTALPDDKGIYRGTDSLYRAELLLDLRDTPQGEYIVPFSSAHIGLDVVVKGYDTFHPGAGAPQIEILSGGMHYNFVEHPAGIPLPDAYKPFVPYVGHSERDDMYRARFDLFRFTDAQAPTLRLTDSKTGKEIVSIRISDYLKSHNLTFDKLHEANLPIMITFTGALNVKINPFVWGSIHIKPDKYK